MGRKKDEEKSRLLKQVQEAGLLVENKNYTKAELQDILVRKAARSHLLDEPKALTEQIAGPSPTNITSAELPIQFGIKPAAATEEEAHDPLHGLSERQRLIARLRMRGLSQLAIAKIVKVSQPIISKEMAAIKEWQISRGRRVDQEEVVGSTVSLYEEVEHKAWELYHSSEEPAEKAKSLTIVMQAREKHTKLLMDLGLLKKAAQEINHTLEVSPFVSRFQESGARELLGNTIVMEQLKALAAPTPDGIEDGEVVEDEETHSIPMSDLAPPTPDLDDDDDE